jgi:hypothetical protein
MGIFKLCEVSVCSGLLTKSTVGRFSLLGVLSSQNFEGNSVNMKKLLQNMGFFFNNLIGVLEKQIQMCPS